MPQTMSTTVEQVIDIRELRIGNYLEYDGKIVHVTMLSCDIDDEYNEQICFCELGKDTDEKGDWNRALADKLNRIILTPPLLVKCGFRLQNPLELETTNTWFKEGMNEFLSYHYDGYWIYQSTKPRIIKYFHQVQNLYFALTGEELKLIP